MENILNKTTAYGHTAIDDKVEAKKEHSTLDIKEKT